jgi:O-antigen ligase
MKKVKTEKSTSNISLTTILIFASAITLYFNPSLEDPFNSPKFWVLVITGSWLLGFLIINIKNLISSKSDRIFLILVAFFIFSFFISAIFTDVKFNAFLGETQRRLGFTTYFFFAIYMVVTAKLTKLEVISKVYYINFLLGTSLGIYGIIQVLGKDPINWNLTVNRVIGTLGNPNFASATMALIACICTSAIFITSFSKFFRLLNLILSLILLFEINTSNSIQGLVAYSAGTGILFIVLLYKTNKFLGHVGLFTYAFTGAVAILGMLQFGPLTDLLYKSSVTVRGYYWNAGIQMLKNNPLTGVGVDRYGAFFKQYRKPEYSLNYGFDITSTNAHNSFIQIFATAGVIAGTCYLLLNLYIIFCGVKLIIQSIGDSKLKVTGLFAAWIVFFSQSIISVDNAGTTIWGWVLGGAIIGLSLKELEKREEIEQKTKVRSDYNSIQSLQVIVSSLFTLISIIFISYLYRGDTSTYQARSYYNVQNPQDSPKFEPLVTKVNANLLIDPASKLNLAALLAQTGKTNEAVLMIDKLLIGDPRNLDMLNTKAALSEFLKDYIKAIEFRKQIEKYDPWNAKNFLQLGVDYKLMGDYESMMVYKEKILKFAPNSEEAKTAITVLVN